MQFKFYDVNEALCLLSQQEKADLSIGVVRTLSDPFYNECRAYGRLIESKVKGTVAARCYGHMAVSADQEAYLRERFGVSVWDRSHKDASVPVSKRQPFCAILKDLIPDTVPLSNKLLNKMQRDLVRMRRLGVFLRDIRLRNYRGGLLVDMSIAITVLHYLFEVGSVRNTVYLLREDMLRFQVIRDESGIQSWDRTTRNIVYCKKLRGCPDGKPRRHRSTKK